MRKIKVIVIDDSALVREILKNGLSADKEIEVVGVAADPYIARDKILKLNPDVLTLDIEMPRMDGVEFLRYLMPQHPLPVVVVSALTKKGAAITMDAFEAGAVDVVLKPGIDVAKNLTEMIEELREKVKIAAVTNVSAWAKKRELSPEKIKVSSKALSESTDKVIAIGASTGGTEAIRSILRRFTSEMPGVVIVQHMPPVFTNYFAESLNGICEMKVKEAENGERVMSGRAYVARGGCHMRVIRSGGNYIIESKPGPIVRGHCPSVEMLFESVAQYVGANAIGVILTGMGSDGADGLYAMRQAGARTIAQDEESSVVYGMPKAALERGGVEAVFPLGEIPQAIGSILNMKRFERRDKVK